MQQNVLEDGRLKLGPRCFTKKKRGSLRPRAANRSPTRLHVFSDNDYDWDDDDDWTSCDVTKRSPMMNRHQFLQPPNRVAFICLGFWHRFYFPGLLDNDLGCICMAICYQMRHLVPSPHLGATTAEHCWGQSGRTASGQIVSFNCCWKSSSSCTWIVFGTWVWSSQLFFVMAIPSTRKFA